MFYYNIIKKKLIHTKTFIRDIHFYCIKYYIKVAYSNANYLCLQHKNVLKVKILKINCIFCIIYVGCYYSNCNQKIVKIRIIKMLYMFYTIYVGLIWNHRFPRQVISKLSVNTYALYDWKCYLKIRINSLKRNSFYQRLNIFKSSNFFINIKKTNENFSLSLLK